MKDSLVPKIVKWIMEALLLDSIERDNVEVLVRKIIKEVRKDYLWELKSDLENTVRNVLNIK
jgi:hypothetical protein